MLHKINNLNFSQKVLWGEGALDLFSSSPTGPTDAQCILVEQMATTLFVCLLLKMTRNTVKTQEANNIQCNPTLHPKQV